MTVQPHSTSTTAQQSPEPQAPVDRPAAVVEPGPRLPGFRGSFAWGVVRALRPRQWVKNVLVLAAPLAAGRALAGAVADGTSA